MIGSYRWLLGTCSTSRNGVGGGGSLCVRLRVYFEGGNLRLRQSISASAASQLFTHPEPRNQSENKQGLMLQRQARVPPRPAGSEGRYTWVVPRAPLFTFKCTHQTIWTSDQILNGVQITQWRRIFYWGEGRLFACVVFPGTEAWLRRSECSRKKWVQNGGANKLPNFSWRTLESQLLWNLGS